MNEKNKSKTQGAICLILGMLSMGLMTLEDKFLYGVGIMASTIFFILVAITSLEDKINEITKSKTIKYPKN